MVLVVSFVLCGRIDGRVPRYLLFFHKFITEIGRQMGLCRKERSIGVANDRMIKMVLLFLYRFMFD